MTGSYLAQSALLVLFAPTAACVAAAQLLTLDLCLRFRLFSLCRNIGQIPGAAS